MHVDIQQHSSKLKSCFLKRGSLKKIVDTEMMKVLRDNKTKQWAPFMDTFHTRLEILQKMIDNNLSQKPFTPKPLISHRSSSKISGY